MLATVSWSLYYTRLLLSLFNTLIFLLITLLVYDINTWAPVLMASIVCDRVFVSLRIQDQTLHHDHLPNIVLAPPFAAKYATN